MMPARRGQLVGGDTAVGFQSRFVLFCKRLRPRDQRYVHVPTAFCSCSNKSYFYLLKVENYVKNHCT